MNDTPPKNIPPKTSPPKTSGPRFSLGMLLLLTLVVAVAAAGLGGMLRGENQRAFFVIFTIAAPVLVLVVVSVWQQLTRRR